MELSRYSYINNLPPTYQILKDLTTNLIHEGSLKVHLNHSGLVRIYIYHNILGLRIHPQPFYLKNTSNIFIEGICPFIFLLEVIKMKCSNNKQKVMLSPYSSLTNFLKELVSRVDNPWIRDEYKCIFKD